LKCVPEGEENAVSSRLIWQQVGMWSVGSVKRELHKMAGQGLIKSKTKRLGMEEVKLYFRETASATVNSTGPI